MGSTTSLFTVKVLRYEAPNHYATPAIVEDSDSKEDPKQVTIRISQHTEHWHKIQNTKYKNTKNKNNKQQTRHKKNANKRK